MLTSKRIDGDYSIVSSSGGTITLGDSVTDPVVIAGNLTISGTLTTVDTVDLVVTDNIIRLNDGEGGAGVGNGTGTSGLEIDRGSELDSFLLWDETNLVWVVNLGDGMANLEIVTVGIGSPSPMFNLVDDTSPTLGGDLDVGAFDITNPINLDVRITVTGTGQITIDGPLVLKSLTVPAVANMVEDEPALFTGADTGGGTQIHFKTRTGAGTVEGVDSTTGELVSKTKAITYALIF